MKGALALLGIYFVRILIGHFFLRYISPTNGYFYLKALNKLRKVEQSTFSNEENQKQKNTLSL